MQMNRLIALIGSFTIALLLVILALYLPAQTVEGRPLLAQQDHSIELPVSLVNTVGRSNTTSSTLSCREGLAGWEPYLSEQIDIQQLGGGIYLDFNAHPQLFLLRVWCEDLGQGRCEWRGRVQHIGSGEVRYFRDWPPLIACLQEMVSD